VRRRDPTAPSGKVTFTLRTLGCDKNTVDSERYVAELLAQGAQLAASPEEADLVIVNTCGFIDAAKAESIEALLEGAALKSRGRCKLVAAVGCMVQRHASELRRALPEVDLFLGTADASRLVPELQARGFLREEAALSHPGVRVYHGLRPHVRYLKISEGCDHGCAFCAIPLMRGRHRSFALGDLVREAQLLELQGAREVNLVAQDLAHYGRDQREGIGLPELLEALLSETGIPWFRLLYIYSAGVTPRLLELIAKEPRIVPYLDMPIQHGSDSVLARMRRPERRAKVRELISRVREAIPDVAIRSTVIVGFPGESDEEFQELLDFLSEIQLERLGVFAYSEQQGTAAAALGDDVPEAIKLERMDRVLVLQRGITWERYERWLGRTVTMLVDSCEAGVVRGRTHLQADEIDGVTLVDAEAEPGAFLEVRLCEIVDDCDFRATLQRPLGGPPPRPIGGPRGKPLPVIASPGAFGR
jgi:ribosomal protein S12 methylthiotransferase